MTERINDVRRRAASSRETFNAGDDRSMRVLELAMAFTAIGVAVLLAVGRA